MANIVPLVRTFEIQWYLLTVDHFCNCLQLISIAKYVWLQILRFADTHSLLFKVSQVSLLHSCVFRGTQMTITEGQLDTWELVSERWNTHSRENIETLQISKKNRSCRCSVKHLGACYSVLFPHTWKTQKLPYSLNWESCLSTLELVALVWT